MITLDKNYINTLKLSGTDTCLIFNGIFQEELSSKQIAITHNQNNIKINLSSKNIQPIHLLLLSSQNSSQKLTITIPANSNISIIEEHINLINEPYTNTHQLEIITENHSLLNYYKLQTLDEKITFKAQTNIIQKQNSKVITHTLTKGSKNNTQDKLQVSLIEQNANYYANGIVTLNNTQQLDYTMQIEHLAANCTSNVLFKGIIDNQAQGNFNCLVKIPPHITKTVTNVTNKNLLLSENAVMNTSPQMEIYNDDIICTHGATVGQLDQNALFYLCSRGISQKQATKLLITAFIKEITETFADYCIPKITSSLNYEC